MFGNEMQKFLLLELVVVIIFTILYIYIYIPIIIKKVPEEFIKL